jgi:hypothetical protein
MGIVTSFQKPISVNDQGLHGVANLKKNMGSRSASHIPFTTDHQASFLTDLIPIRTIIQGPLRLRPVLVFFQSLLVIYDEAVVSTNYLSFCN